MMKTNRRHVELPAAPRAGFTLLEVLVVLTIASLLMIAALGLYHRVRVNAATIESKLIEDRLSEEVLQRIAEDIDRMTAPGFSAALTLRNKIDNGYYSAQLMITNTYAGARTGIYERITWQTRYDPFEGAMILYRMHEGLNREDKLLDAERTQREAELFVPITGGVTFFELNAVQNEKLIPNWVSTKLPAGVRIGISFAPLTEQLDGGFGIAETDIRYRTAAVDRTRMISYRFVPKVFDVNDFLRDDLLEEMTEEELMEEETEEPMDDEPEIPEIDPEILERTD